MNQPDRSEIEIESLAEKIAFSARDMSAEIDRDRRLPGELVALLREAFFGVQRFGQLARNLSIPRPTLSSRLRMLVNVGLLDRVLYSRDPERHEYRLTDAGRDLFGAIVVLMQWGDEHLPHPDGPPIVLRHNTCGEFADPRLVCAHCGEEITARNVTPEAGPGFRTRPASRT
jgi:DNA-binding HxlR family transcriptional regulator